jgi:1,4-dihydroxy-2-naphthoyl-CoA hydrolase
MSAELPSVDLSVASPFVAAMKFEVAESTGSRVTGHVDLGSDQHTPWGVVHGGVYTTAVESACSIGASLAVIDNGEYAVGLANHTDFLRPHVEGELRVTATPVQQGRTQQLWQCDIARADGKLVARGQLRLQNVPLAR